MKKTLAAFVILTALALSGCIVGVSSVQPPHARYHGQPSLVVIPGTYVYAMTDVDDDIYFHVGWWWRQWDGRWYTSRHYDRGWNHYRGVPGFYREVDPGWREFYRHRRWHGHPWACERIPASHVQRDWHRWQNARHWEREKNWGVQGFRPEPYRQASLGPQRDRHEDRQRHSWREERRRGTGDESDRRREFTKDGSRNGVPFFGNRGTDDRAKQGFDRERSSERRVRRQQPAFERQRREDGATQAKMGDRQDERRSMRDRQTFRGHQRPEGENVEVQGDRQRSGQQGSRRDRSLFGQGRREPAATDQPRQERSSERLTDDAVTPHLQGRHREGRTERLQQGASDIRQSRAASRQREVGQERRRDGHNRRRPAQELPGQGGGQSGTPETMPPQ